ncbi:hypothetical protein F4811DRAFT_574308 [Daldinia bambusicola]|nr:hypothetical protein F4811DRAFT_574308 [Daldinia bambusicola]
MPKRGLNILLLSIRPLGHDDFPTCVVNLEMRHLPAQLPLDETGNWPLDGNLFHASGKSLASLPSYLPIGELQVKGIIIGSVQHIVVSSTTGEDPDLVGRHTFSLNHVEVATSSVVNTLRLSMIGRISPSDLGKLVDSFRCWIDIFMYPDCSLVTAQDIEAAAQLDPSSADHSEVINNALRTAKIGSSDKTLSDAVKKYILKAKTFHYYCCFRLANWGFLSLETGHIGRAYFNCRENDKDALLAGSDVPFVLREVRRDRYQLVAPAYVSGIMDGELWPEDEREVKDMILV